MSSLRRKATHPKWHVPCKRQTQRPGFTLYLLHLQRMRRERGTSKQGSLGQIPKGSSSASSSVVRVTASLMGSNSGFHLGR